MVTYYSDERNVQILIFLMKAHGIKKVVASPGATNVCLVGSLQQDPYFEMYSCVDERSAAYLACGLSAESGEPVALSCTGATASRNYIPGLTEAFYRKLPILAITSTQHIGRIGNNIPQVIDRTRILNDIAKLSVQIPTIHDADDEWSYGVMINRALLELRHHGGGPVHINLTTTYSRNFTVKELPNFQVIDRIGVEDSFPEIKGKRVGIFVGSHKKWSVRLSEAVERFCEAYNGVVFCDHTSNYPGKYRVLYNLVGSQEQYSSPSKEMDILIHIGDVSASGAYMNLREKEVWRVNPDGEIRDTFRRLRYTFEMSEECFFENYNRLANGRHREMEYYSICDNEYKDISSRIPELPFSNAWIAQQTCPKIPSGSVLHLGILNTLRIWNYFEILNDILGYSNTGGFGIDGLVSSILGASIHNEKKLYFGIIGDLAFFYDLNAIGNRHVGPNLRLLIVNNGKGTEFRNYNHIADTFGDDADLFMAAGGHFGKQSRSLVKHYAQDLGFEYFAASNKEEYQRQLPRFISSEIGDKPILFEIFTDSEDERDALQVMKNLKVKV